MSVSVDEIKKLRQDSGAGIADCRIALEETKGDMAKAKAWLQEHGIEKSAGKIDRETKSGLVETYSHGGKIGILVTLLCETDFVARTDDFKFLAHEIALQVASMKPENTEALLKQEYIRDSSQTIEALIKSYIAKLGENIKVASFSIESLV